MRFQSIAQLLLRVAFRWFIVILQWSFFCYQFWLVFIKLIFFGHLGVVAFGSISSFPNRMIRPVWTGSFSSRQGDQSASPGRVGDSAGVGRFATDSRGLDPAADECATGIGFPCRYTRCRSRSPLRLLRVRSRAFRWQPRRK